MSESKLPDKWDEETDVVIVGSGFAGLAAAIEAKNAGSSVVVLEKMKGYGGNSTISDGVIAACGTRMQSDRGIQDSPQLMVADMLRAGFGLNHPELVQTLAENAGNAFRWIIDSLGVSFMDRVDQFGGHSVPRSYTPVQQSGSAIVRQLLRKVKALGSSIRTRNFLERIIEDHENRICGVSVRDGYDYPDSASGARKYLRIRKALILAGGGFGNDIGLRSAQDPRLDHTVGTTNKYATTGETIREAMRIGAMPVHLSWIQLGPWTTPDEKGYGIGGRFIGYAVLPFGIIVDPSSGERFVNELGDRKQVCDAILNVGNPCIGIADQKGVDASGWDVRRAIKRGVVNTSNRIEEIANIYGISKQKLKQTIERFNASFADRKDTTFNKPILEKALPLQHPPYYGVRIWPKVHYTMGGILINSNAQVLDVENRPIEGLFAAGEITGGVHGACRLGGCAITDCIVFGRIAGKRAATLKY